MITALCSVRITQWVEIISEREEYFRLNERSMPFHEFFFSATKRIIVKMARWKKLLCINSHHTANLNFSANELRFRLLFL